MNNLEKPQYVSADGLKKLQAELEDLRTTKRDTPDFLLNVSVSGEPPRERQPEKDEKPEQKQSRDKDFAESRKRLEGRLALEKVLSDWTYVVEAKQLEPLLKTREQMVAQKKAEGDGAEQSGRTSSKGVKRK